MLVWEYTYRTHIIHIVCMFGKCIMGYEYFIYRIDMCLDVSV